MAFNSILSLFCLTFLLAFVGFYYTISGPTKCVDCDHSKSAGNCFRAAVLDHVQQVGKDEKDVKANAQLNLDLYDTATKLAKKAGADIIVFPENGIYFSLNTRESVLQHGEVLPDDKTDMCVSKYQKSAPVAARLACMAKKNQIFLAADIIDLQPCSSQCPSDHKYAFNTAVLFDRNGILLAKYHKMHLFGEMTLNPPPKDELIIINTEIGRLGLQVCFDMIYRKPGVALAQLKQIDTMVYPTWWYDELPFLGASQFQQAWAFSNEINLLASNIHKLQIGSKGSGIYAGSVGKFATLDYPDMRSRILVSTIPTSAQSPSPKCTSMDTKVIEVPQNSASPKQEYLYKNMDLQSTEKIRVEPDKDEIKLCHSGVCCNLKYKMDSTTVDLEERYYLIASNRTRKGAYQWTEEFCGMIHCPLLKRLEDCVKVRSNVPLKTRFQYAKLTATVSETTVVYPSVVGSQHKLLSLDDGAWKYESSASKSNKIAKLSVGSKSNTKSSGWHISTLGLYGRAYERDPPYQQKPLANLIGG